MLLPDIRDHFDLSNAGALRLVALTTIAVLLIEIPLSFYCDRGNRVRIATIGATVWALFSFGTGGAIVVGSLGMLIVMRIGAGIGRAVVTPTHSSLLSDYYEPAARVKVFSAHRQANSVGQILGPLLAGVIAAVARAGVAVLPLRHPDPRVRRRCRCASTSRCAATTSGRRPVTTRRPRWSPMRTRVAWSTMKVLHQVRTIRRIWWAVPFVGVTLFGVTQLLNLVYEDVFDVDSAGRGLIAAAAEPLQVIGVFVAMPRIAKIAMTDPGFLLRFVAIVGVVDGFVLVGAGLRAPPLDRHRDALHPRRRRSARSRRRSSRSSRSWRRHGSAPRRSRRSRCSPSPASPSSCR